MTYSRTTYQRIKDDVASDLASSPRVANITDEAFVNWILRAEEEICRKIDVTVSHLLRYTTDIEYYFVRNRPFISAFSSAGVVAASGHGLSVGDVINIRDLQGLTPSAGRFIVTASSTGFTVKRFARATGATNDSPIVVEAKDHGFNTGDVVTGAEFAGITAANAIFTVTNIDPDHLSLDSSVGNAEYESGGVLTAVVSATGTYLGGGRFWHEEEVPDVFKRLTLGERELNGIRLVVDPEDEGNISRFAANQGIRVSSSGNAPRKMGFTERGGFPVLRLFPTPADTNDLILTGCLQFKAVDYTDHTIDMNVALPDDFTNIIRAYVKARVFERIGDDKRSILWEQMFDSYLSQKRRSMFPTNIRIARIFQ